MSDAWQNEFFALFDDLSRRLRGEEVLLAALEGEDSQFVRFNRGLVRHAMNVRQMHLRLDLVRGQRRVAETVALTGRKGDRQRLRGVVRQLRQRLDEVPDDPYVLYNTQVQSTECTYPSQLPEAAEVVHRTVEVCRQRGRDLVGLYAQGAILDGFANSLGQRNWFAAHTFNFHWSFYHPSTKAVQTGYAGLRFSDEDFQRRLDEADQLLPLLGRPSKTIPPGQYRTYLSPRAVDELIGMLAGGDLGIKAQRTRQSCLSRMTDEGTTLHPSITLRESLRDGAVPNFQSDGFLKPDDVPLIESGRLAGALVSPRSEKEYGVPCNGAGADEAAVSLELAAGELPRDEVRSQLGTGVWVGNLWYLNFSDRPACRITGMTRFATFWVDQGELVGPLEPMRFDETLYRALGDQLRGLTRERELFISTNTYRRRSTANRRMPGVLVDDFTFTL